MESSRLQKVKLMVGLMLACALLGVVTGLARITQEVVELNHQLRQGNTHLEALTQQATEIRLGVEKQNHLLEDLRKRISLGGIE